MKTNREVDSVQHEKLKLHIKYIITIAVILFFGSIILATHNQNEFVSQISFGSTMTSIILSVIAIWMSISGERTTNDIKTKISYSADRLSETTKKVEILNNNYEKTMDTQLEELKTVQEQLSKILSSVDNVSQEVSQMQKNIAPTSTSENNTLNSDQKKVIFNSIYQWATYSNQVSEFIFCHMIYFISYNLQNANKIQLNEVVTYLYRLNINTNAWSATINIDWGIINTLITSSLFNDKSVMDYIHNTISKYVNLQMPPI